MVNLRVFPWQNRKIKERKDRAFQNHYTHKITIFAKLEREKLPFQEATGQA